MPLRYSAGVPRPLTDLADWTTIPAWPRVGCPECRIGTVGHEAVTQHLDAASRALVEQSRRDWNGPDELSGPFSGTLACDNHDCEARLVVAGDWAYSWDVDLTDGSAHLTDFYRVRFVLPPLRLFEPPAATPSSVQAEITASGVVVFANPSAAGNRLRRAVEELLDAQRVRKTELRARRGKQVRERLSLHQRIELFGVRYPNVKDVLLAVKWIGNDATHGQEMTVADVLLCATVLEAALRSLYDRSDADLRALVSRINSQRGLGRRVG